MKKLFLGLILLLLVIPNVKADMPDTVQTNEYVGNTLVKSSSGKVFSIKVTYIGATAGDFVSLTDSTTSGGTMRYRCVATASSGNCTDSLTVASYFGTAILYTEQKSAGAAFRTYIQYF